MNTPSFNVVEMNFSGEQQRKFVEAFLASEAVADRAQSLQRSFDCLVQEAYELGEITLAVALIGLMACRNRELHAHAAGNLLSLVELNCKPGESKPFLGRDQ
ncbi:hypothetical protein [Singulisphaera sp. PoT]|uniref:hypothetical protein n=1 Tax=Singulisphaera sp. PoT TaxID=3411797 RepID=UPI003BF475FB